METPFDDWWERVRAAFPTVPVDVARYWLYEHWSHSPFRWLPSRDYRFELVDWGVGDLNLIRSRWCNYADGNDDCRAHGDYLLSLRNYKTANFMAQEGMPPAPIIVLDNRDGRFKTGQDPVPVWKEVFPPSYVLVEGHRRFNLALALHGRGQLNSMPVWVMRSV